MSVQPLPEKYSLQQLYHKITTNGNSKSHGSVILNEYLQHPERQVREGTDLEYAKRLLTWLSRSIRPSGDEIIHDDGLEGYQKSEKHMALEHLRVRSALVFQVMQILHTAFVPQGAEVDPDFLLGLIAYTDLNDPWTSKSAQEGAEKLLNRHQKQLFTQKFIIEHLLISFIRPLFSGSRTPTVTSQGRKALDATPGVSYLHDDLDPSNKPWKLQDVSAATVFAWAIKHMNEAMIYKAWHLCIPPLLTLLDDTSTPFRAQGLLIFSDMLSKTPPKVLQQTGLGEVFEDAIMPTLLFLPTLTPEKDSVRLLKPAYAVLFILGDVWFPNIEERYNKRRFLDRIMRQGVLRGFLHSGDNVNITRLLLEEVSLLISSMGVHAVKHLKELIPILSRTLTDPFGPAHSELLLVAVNATQTLILNCWPRMTEPAYRVELIKSLSICWTITNEDTSREVEPQRAGLEAVGQALKVAAMMLVKSVQGRFNMEQELEPLLEASPALRALFGSDGAMEAYDPDYSYIQR